MSDHPEDSAWERSLASSASEILEEPGDILRALRRATLDSKLVELEFANRSRIFFSELTEGPHPDEEAALVERERERKSQSLIEGILRRANEEESPASEELPLRPRMNYDYLEKKTHLFLAPLVPMVGNAMLPNSHMLLLRVFHGVKALEAPSVYMGSLEIGEERLIKVGFPMRVFIFAKRRHFRAQVAPYMQILVEVTPENRKGLPFTTKMMNISAGGLAFCNPMGLGTPEVEQRLNLTLYPEDQPEIKVTGIVRNHAPNTPKEGCGKSQSRCGVQFELNSQEQSMRIEELVALVQRQVISMVAETKGTTPPPKLDARRGAPKKEPGALEKFFEVKRRKAGG